MVMTFRSLVNALLNRNPDVPAAPAVPVEPEPELAPKAKLKAGRPKAVRSKPVKSEVTPKTKQGRKPKAGDDVDPLS